MNNADPAIGFIGIGLLGRALSSAMAQQGYRVVGAQSRRAASAEDLAGRIAGPINGCLVYEHAQELADAVDVVFITTPDSVIEEVAGQLKWRTGQGVVHCCGAAALEILSPAIANGALAGAFHPCQTFAGLDGPGSVLQRLQGVAFAVTAQGWLQDFLPELARKLGGTPISIPDAGRPLYHAASVLACGYMAALLKGAVDIWEGLGFTQEQALAAIYPLSRATLENVARDGVAATATGPVMRADVGTIENHLQALSRSNPELIPVYRALAQASLPIAELRGVGQQGLEEMRAVLARFMPQEQRSQAR
jgi:predicted short-subunit dehydrogenase-like oxidoreductase (DUF2520 family)